MTDFNNNNVLTNAKPKSLMAAQTQYVESIGKGLTNILGNMDKYQALCGYNILNAINNALASKGLNHTSPTVDKESINNAIKYAVVYSLNTDNNEVFVITRNTKVNNTYVTKIECKPMYKGYLSLLRRYGNKVKKVYPEWIVREGDDFTYATYKGVELVPPTWTPKVSTGKVVRVVVPVEYDDGYIDYRIAERESIATNIKAQISQSLMGNPNKEQVLEKIKDYTLEQLMTDADTVKYVNETYKGISKEEMVITKLVLNATKRIGLDYSKALPNDSRLARELDEKTYDNAEVYTPKHRAEQIIADSVTPEELIEEQPKQVETASQLVEEPIKEEPKSVADLFNDDDIPF